MCRTEATALLLPRNDPAFKGAVLYFLNISCAIIMMSNRSPYWILAATILQRFEYQIRCSYLYLLFFCEHIITFAGWFNQRQKNAQSAQIKYNPLHNKELYFLIYIKE